MNVPLLDLVAQYKTIKDEVQSALQRVIESQQFIMGPAIAELETASRSISSRDRRLGPMAGIDVLVQVFAGAEIQGKAARASCTQPSRPRAV